MTFLKDSCAAGPFGTGSGDGGAGVVVTTAAGDGALLFAGEPLPPPHAVIMQLHANQKTRQFALILPSPEQLRCDEVSYAFFMLLKSRGLSEGCRGSARGAIRAIVHARGKLQFKPEFGAVAGF